MNKEFWTQTISFGNLTVPRFMTAPMDGLTTSPFRQLIREFSPHELMITEMRHVAQVVHEKDQASLRYNPIEQPLAFQFSANKIDFIEQAIEKVLIRNFIMINLNAGCPAPVVIKSGSGSSLMGNVAHLEQLIKCFIKAINGRVPFTLKIRAGFKEKNALSVAQMAQDNGVDGIIIHPRTQPERFASRLDFDLVASIKKSLTIPVVFSGNINSFQAAHKTYELTGVDGFMIGRALWGAPWKLREITEASQGSTWSVDTLTAITYAIKHLDLNIQHYGPHGFNALKKQLPQYIRSLPHASALRSTLLRSKTEQEMRDILLSLVEETKQSCIPYSKNC